MKKKVREDKLYRLYILLAAVVLVWVFSIPFIHWISSLSYVNWPIDERAAAGRAAFGDSFGAINSLFSGMALAGIIYTIFLQKKELALQREELKETRKEFKTQNVTLRLQRFENTFFNLLSLHHQIVDSIDEDVHREKKKDKIIPNFGTHYKIETTIDPNQEPDTIQYESFVIKGRDVFKYHYENLVTYLNETESTKTLNDAYLECYEIVQTDFGHYFRNLYRIIKLVNETEFHPKENFKKEDNKNYELNEDELNDYRRSNHNTRYKYTSLVRAQLSNFELLWVFYNCLSNNGNEKFKPLVEKYSLLKNTSFGLQDSNHLDLYEKSAFKKIIK